MAAYFNATLFRRNMKRFWPLAVFCLVTAFFVFLAPELGRQDSYYIGQSNREILSLLSGYCAGGVPVFSAFAALAVFGYLHNARAANYISALPVTRTGLFITNYISGLAMILVPNLLIGLLYVIALSGEAVSAPQYLAWFGIMTAANLLFYSMAVFCAFLTGNPFMQILLYALINFLYPLLYAIASVMSAELVYGFDGSLPFWSLLSPPVAMLSELWPLYKRGAAGTALIIWLGYLVFAAVLIWGAHALYRRRRIESAGDVIIHKPLRPVFKYLMTFLLGAFLGALLTGLTGGFSDSAKDLSILLAAYVSLFGAISCLFIEMLLRKRLKVWGTAWKGILCYICAIAALALFIRVDGTGFERRVPHPEDIQAVSVMRWSRMDDALLSGYPLTIPQGYPNSEMRIYAGGNGWQLSDTYVNNQLEQGLPLIDSAILEEIKLRNPEYFESPGGIAAAVALHETIISEKSAIEELSRGSNSISFVITYKMKDSSVITRRYYLPRSDEYALETIDRMTELANLPEAVDKRNRFLSLPDAELLGALAVGVVSRYDIPYIVSDKEMYYDVEIPENITISGEGLPVLIDAMRRDAEAGTLGRVTWRELTEYDNTIGKPSEINISVSLCYNSVVVPPAFLSDQIYNDGVNRDIYGYVLRVPVSRSCVNTADALGKLGFTGTNAQ